jgi:hypothetical protein
MRRSWTALAQAPSRFLRNDSWKKIPHTASPSATDFFRNRHQRMWFAAQNSTSNRQVLITFRWICLTESLNSRGNPPFGVLCR